MTDIPAGPGQRASGLDGINKPIFALTGGFIAAFCILALVSLEPLTVIVDTGFAWVARMFGLYWQLLLLATFLIGLLIAVLPGGRAVMGNLDRPEFTVFQWGSMIMGTLLAGGGVFWAAGEPMAHFMSVPPVFAGIEAGTAEAVPYALAQSYLHWGFPAWAILANLTTIMLMHYHYEKGLPLAPRTLLYPVLGDRAINGAIGYAADAACIIAVVAGTVGPIGFLGLQVGYGLETLFGIPDNFATQASVIFALTCLYLLSAISGVNKGIQLLSRINMILGGVLLVTMGWFTIVGGTGPGIEFAETGAVSTAFEGLNLPAALLAITQAMPLGFIVSLLFLVLTTIFVATTGDSMTCVLSVSMSDGANPSTLVRVFRGVAMGLMAVILISVGSGGIGTLQSFIVVTAAPVSLILLPSLWDAVRITLEKGRAGSRPDTEAWMTDPFETRSSDSLAAFRRSPAEVMRLERMGCSHPTRLSFLRQILRRITAEGWRFDRPVWRMGARGTGRAVYRMTGPEGSLSLVAFAHDLPDAVRSDRVMATAWDATFTLYDGTPDADDLDRLAANVPLQEAGRVSPRELSLSRANRSVRLFEHVVARLAAGQQPDARMLRETGYLMRTTAVYGSGKFGAADRTMIAGRPALGAPFQAEMLSVWLIRTFTVDLVEHVARMRGGTGAARLAPDLRREPGVGNSTGLGMAPFLVRHRVLLNNWMAVREEALARVRAQGVATETTLALFRSTLAGAMQNATDWQSTDPVQATRLADLRSGPARLDAHVARGWATYGPHPWDALWHWGRDTLPFEAQEALLAAMLEPHGHLIDGLACGMQADEETHFGIDGSMRIAALRSLLQEHYGWALGTDYAAPEHCAQFWYISAEKLEPRVGARFDENGAARELPLDIGRRAAALWHALAPRPTTPRWRDSCLRIPNTA